MDKADIPKWNSTIFKGEKHMKHLSKQEKHEQCMREIKSTLIVVALCCV
jgi:hypothetical protein